MEIKWRDLYFEGMWKAKVLPSLTQSLVWIKWSSEISTNSFYNIRDEIGDKLFETNVWEMLTRDDSDPEVRLSAHQAQSIRRYIEEHSHGVRENHMRGHLGQRLEASIAAGESRGQKPGI